MADPVALVIAKLVDSDLLIWSGFESGFVSLVTDSNPPVFFAVYEVEAVRSVLEFSGGDCYQVGLKLDFDLLRSLSVSGGLFYQPFLLGK